jgi:hypothetical protein
MIRLSLYAIKQHFHFVASLLTIPKKELAKHQGLRKSLREYLYHFSIWFTVELISHPPPSP